MLTVITLATLLAQPCMAPKPHKHHAHARPEPVQSCVTPPVPMCFREPAPEPDLLPIAAPLIYYMPSADTPTAGETPPGEPSISWDSVPLMFGPTVGTVGGYEPPDAPPPVTGPNCCAVPPRHEAPELSVDASVSGLILLLGTIAILRSSRNAI